MCTPFPRHNDAKCATFRHWPELEPRLSRFFKRWYRTNGRAFPWREPTVSPFGILVAEMLLRQTRAVMVAEVWPQLIARFPTPQHVVDANDDELYALVAPLGFGRQRAGALKDASRALVEAHAGHVPDSIPALLEIPHIGLYAAHAVACFAFGRRVPVVDTNVLRVFSRLTGVDFGRDIRRGNAPEAWDLARRILPARSVREHNYGLLDFSAQVCAPSKPFHERCPLADVCATVRNRASSNV